MSQIREPSPPLTDLAAVGGPALPAPGGERRGPLPAIPDRTVHHRQGREDLARYVLVALFGLVLYLFVLYPMAHLA